MVVIFTEIDSSFDVISDNYVRVLCSCLIWLDVFVIYLFMEISICYVYLEMSVWIMGFQPGQWDNLMVLLARNITHLRVKLVCELRWCLDHGILTWLMGKSEVIVS